LAIQLGATFGILISFIFLTKTHSSSPSHYLRDVLKLRIAKYGPNNSVLFFSLSTQPQTMDILFRHIGIRILREVNFKLELETLLLRSKE